MKWMRMREIENVQNAYNTTKYIWASESVSLGIEWRNNGRIQCIL